MYVLSKEEQDEGCDVQDGANTDQIEGLILLKRDDGSIICTFAL